MELRHLRAFRAIMQTGSTVDAAQALGLSQPSVSRLLAEFEAATGESLFIRTQGRLVARDVAEGLLPDVERALSQIDNLRARAEGCMAPLRIAGPAGVVTHIFAPAVRRLQADRPGQKIVAEIMSNFEVVGAVASGRVDMGFVKAPAAHPALDLIDLVEVGTDVVLPDGHRLAGQARITPRDLDGEQLVLPGHNRPFRVELDQIFQRAPFPARCRHRDPGRQRRLQLRARGVGDHHRQRPAGPGRGGRRAGLRALRHRPATPVPAGKAASTVPPQHAGPVRPPCPGRGSGPARARLRMPVGKPACRNRTGTSVHSPDCIINHPARRYRPSMGRPNPRQRVWHRCRLHIQPPQTRRQFERPPERALRAAGNASQPPDPGLPDDVKHLRRAALHRLPRRTGIPGQAQP